MIYIGLKFIVILLSSLAVACAMTSLCIHLSVTKRHKRCTVTVRATVRGVEHRFIERLGDTPFFNWYPTFEYPVDGKMHVMTSKKGASQKTFKVNQRLTLLYNPEDPDEILVPNQGETLLGDLFAFAAALCLVAEIVICIMS